jgi:hypothetical protein
MGAKIQMFWKILFLIVAWINGGVEFLISFLRIPKSWKIKFYSEEASIPINGIRTKIRYSNFENTSIKLPKNISLSSSFGLMDNYNKAVLGTFPLVNLEFEYDGNKISRRLMLGSKAEQRKFMRILEKNFQEK